ncbi:hypothetical protein PFTANZ_00155 [Plasmodium falciparum Tanzania (2000708)]|uniref:Plasmodium falciparum erythrocyte membrane protein 1 acidic terminal segment domain-containing protein n=1 Tax=Plasmodium falciparum Tanzania (2000708) TaxID=1036725 RepID=A0A024WE00_PLAFA|nr:hypothetical protein PFTANZ_00155 [Plasmodium falciparum Tanzania (2000708)]
MWKAINLMTTHTLEIYLYLIKFPKKVMKNTIDDNMYKDIQPEDHIINVNMREKSFIISIHDRDLHNVNNLSYNINMDGQNNNIFSTNTKDNPTYLSNNLYSGIGITNNSLHDNHHIDIYDEKNTTSTFNIAKKKKIKNNNNSDPINCQLNLFHKWLDRHRHICAKSAKKIKCKKLDKLKEEWNKDNNKHNGENIINKMLNIDVSIQIDMDNPKPTNEFTNMDTYTDKYIMDTIVDNME